MTVSSESALGAKQAQDAERSRLSALFSAAAGGSEEELLAALPEAGCAGAYLYEYRDANGRTALHFAASAPKSGALEKLLQVARDEAERSAATQAEDANGDTPLRLATRLGRVENARLLFHAAQKASSSTEQAESKSALTSKPSLLHEAASSGSTEMVRTALDEFGLAGDVEQRSSVGTPLFWAAFNDNAEICKLLLDAGADANARDSQGLSPLLIAVTRNSGSVARELVAAPGISLQVHPVHESTGEEVQESTVLHAGAELGCVEALKAVFASAPLEPAVRAALGQRSKLGGGEPLTPLELAAYSGQRESFALVAQHLEVDECTRQAIWDEQQLKRAQAAEEAAALNMQEAGQVDKFKEEANDLFKAGNVPAAVERYTQAIKLAEAILARAESSGQTKSSALEAKEEDERPNGTLDDAKERLAVLLSNRSAAHLKVGDALHALADGQKSAELRPKYAKAHYRVGMAQSALGQHIEAAQAYWQGYEVAPKDPGAQTMFQLFHKAAAIAKEEHQLKQRGAVRAAEPVAKSYTYNLPVEIPVDSSPGAALRTLTLSFDDGEQPVTVAARFVQNHVLDPSLVPRIAHYVHEHLTST